MKTPRPTRRKRSESGVALLIAIFILLLISAVAITMIVSSGTESSLSGNYRSSTGAYYAAVSGLEEARGRLVPSNSSTIWTTANFASSQPALPIGKRLYIVNPSATGETTAGILSTYPDAQYAYEFPGVATTTTTIPSLFSTTGNNGPVYKWVRINAATKQSLGVDVDGTGVNNNANKGMPLYYDSGLATPKLIVPTGTPSAPTNVPSTAKQVFEITTLAVLPNGTQKLLQYVVAPVSYNLQFPAALTLAGNVGVFDGATSNPYNVNGTDGSGNPPPVPGCTPNSANSYAAIGATDAAGSTTNKQTIVNGIPSNRVDNYTGGGLSTPSVADVTLNSTLNTPASLDQLIQTLKQNADTTLQPPANQTGNYGWGDLPSSTTAAMTADPPTPKVVFVDGNFDLGPNTGTGILVVTGNFTYRGNSGWRGIVLVVGDGTTTFDGLGGGNGEFDGAVLVATTRDAAGNLLTNFGTVNYTISGGGGNGIYYNSCWINNVQQPPTYQILSFREIPQ